MIVIESTKKKTETILKQHPDAMIIDVTSKATNEYVKLSPFYPHRGIPIPFSGTATATCVEAVWQGLKTFENADVDRNMFQNDTMKNLKRTVRKFGAPKGHRKGVFGKELLGYRTARNEIYIPTYKWMLENKAKNLVEKLRALSQTKTVVLLDYNTSTDVDDLSKPLSHAYLIKAYIEELYPYSV